MHDTVPTAATVTLKDRCAARIHEPMSAHARLPQDRGAECGSQGTSRAGNMSHSFVACARVLAALALVTAVTLAAAASDHQRDATPSTGVNGGAPVCIASVALLGPSKSSGLATAMTNLALELAAADVPVTLLFSGHSLDAPDHWRAVFEASGVRLVVVPAAEDMGGVDGGALNGGAVAYRGTVGQQRSYAYVALCVHRACHDRAAGFAVC